MYCTAVGLTNITAPTPGSKVKILFLGANPSDTTRLALDREVREITQRLRATPCAEQFELAYEWAMRVGDIQAALLRHKPHVVHFSGHGAAPDAAAEAATLACPRDLLPDEQATAGEDSGGILVEDNSGKAVPLAASALADLLRVVGGVRCVVLNACHSAAQADTIRQHVDCVVGMGRAIQDHAAIAFAWAFYQGLGFGEPITKAFELGRNQIHLAGFADVDVPQLLMREAAFASVLDHVAPAAVSTPSADQREHRTGHTEVGWRPLAHVKNPYDPWTPATGDRFVGRADCLRLLERAATEGRSISLIGDWRIGKSSVLLHWAEVAQRLGFDVHFASGDQQSGASPSAFVHEVTKMNCTSDDPDEAATTLARWVDTRRRSRPNRQIVIVDEADQIFVRFQPRFFERLRGMLDRLSLVIASRQSIDRIHEEMGRTSPLRNRLQIAWLGLLDSTSRETVLEFGALVLEQTDQDLLRRWAGCHPFYLQMLGHYLFDAIVLGEPRAAAIDRFVIEASARINELWLTLSERERAGLLGILHGTALRPQVSRTLRARGLIDGKEALFGEVLAEWLRDQE